MGSDHFWKLEHCSNEALLSQLQHIVFSGRRLTAELVAHLGEVEDRRLHLEAACSSMFDYCTRRLGLSEDEACRRIEVARLARRFPALFPRLASGELSLTVAAMLKAHLSPDNEARLLDAVKGKTAAQAREALAALFPKPDAPELVRKLPERRVPVSALSATPLIAASTTMAPPTVASAAPPASAQVTEPPQRIAPATTAIDVAPPVSRGAASSLRSARIEPLSEARYLVQLTVSAELKRKLEQARDLMRHRNPGGDLSVVVERALDLLLDQVMKERFGVTDNPRQRGSKKDHITSSTRRAVLAHDGLQCSWVDAEGHRCPATAWLELDHRQPRGRGGGAGPENIRLLCRNHNRLAAEREYGRGRMESAIAQRGGLVSTRSATRSRGASEA
jgi:hypothetical protein